jgi:hypothetical protein
MHFLFLLHEPAEHDWRTMLLVMVGVLLVVALIDSLAGGLLKRLDNAGRTHPSKKRKHKQGK